MTQKKPIGLLVVMEECGNKVERQEGNLTVSLCVFSAIYSAF